MTKTKPALPPLIAGLYDLVTIHEANQGVGNLEVVIATAGLFKNVLAAASDNRSRVKSKDDFESFSNSIDAIRTVVSRGDGGAAAIIARSTLGKWWNS